MKITWHPGSWRERRSDDGTRYFEAFGSTDDGATYCGRVEWTGHPEQPWTASLSTMRTAKPSQTKVPGWRFETFTGAKAWCISEAVLDATRSR